MRVTVALQASRRVEFAGVLLCTIAWRRAQYVFDKVVGLVSGLRLVLRGYEFRRRALCSQIGYITVLMRVPSMRPA